MASSADQRGAEPLTEAELAGLLAEERVDLNALTLLTTQGRLLATIRALQAECGEIRQTARWALFRLREHHPHGLSGPDRERLRDLVSEYLEDSNAE